MFGHWELVLSTEGLQGAPVLDLLQSACAVTHGDVAPATAESGNKESCREVGKQLGAWGWAHMASCYE